MIYILNFIVSFLLFCPLVSISNDKSTYDALSDYKGSEVAFKELTKNGRLVACNIHFNALQTGFINLPPRDFFSLNGTLSVLNPFDNYKEASYRFSIDEAKIVEHELKFYRKKVSSSYLKADGGINTIGSSFNYKHEENGSFLAMINIDENFMSFLHKMRATKELSLMFTITDNAFDEEVPIKLTMMRAEREDNQNKINRTRSDKALNQFFQCLNRMKVNP